MTQQLVLSEPQLSLIQELLEGEQTQRLIEIRHTDTATFRVGLKERLAAVESLIQQIQTASPAATAQRA